MVDKPHVLRSCVTCSAQFWEFGHPTVQDRLQQCLRPKTHVLSSYLNKTYGYLWIPPASNRFHQSARKGGFLILPRLLQALQSFPHGKNLLQDLLRGFSVGSPPCSGSQALTTRSCSPSDQSKPNLPQHLRSVLSLLRLQSTQISEKMFILSC